MKITKFGHSCVLVEETGAKILIDPGNLSTLQNEVQNVDAVLITHGHGDHLDPASLKTILSNNLRAKVMTNSEVAEILEKENIDCKILEHGQSAVIKGVDVEGFGEKHAIIYPTLPPMHNTGYLIARKFFHPGDAFYNPLVPIEILVLPVSAPWCKLQEAIDYAKEIKPKFCFPIHDGFFRQVPGSVYKIPAEELAKTGGKFVILEGGKTIDF